MKTTTATAIKFHRHYVTDGSRKARVWYSLDNQASGQRVVTLYAKDYDRTLGTIIPTGYENDSDMQIDYFDHGRVRIFENHPLYAAARARAEQVAVRL